MRDLRQLRVNAAFSSNPGRRKTNQDYVGISAEEFPVAQGFVAAIADGVSYGNGGRVAAELTVRTFIDGFYSAPPTQGIARNCIHTMSAINAWLHAVAAADPKLQHASTTFTSLVLAGRQAHVLHAGDSRAWHLHGEQLTQLTQDHTLQQPERDHVLIRAVGMEPTVRLDHHTQGLRAHDRLLLTTDGIHSVLPDRQLRALLLRRRSPEEDVAALIEQAIEAGSQDNLSCVIIDVLEVPEVSAPELMGHFAHLPLVPPPAPGTVLDEFSVQGVLSKGRYSQLLRARDLRSARDVVLKFPQRDVASESTFHAAFVREAWVSARLHSPHVGETITLPPDRQTCLYSVMPFYEGETLEARIGRGPRIAFDEGMQIAQQLIRAVASLHRAGIIHRDIKPENILLQRDGGLRLIDLGVARLPMIEEFPATDIPGTPSYMAPELFEGRLGDEASDQFALGVTLFRMFTGKYPYGEIEPFTRPRFTQPAALSRLRPDLPAWVGHIISQAVKADAAQRFGDVLEMGAAIEGAMAGGVPQSVLFVPLYDRNPLRFWQCAAALLALALLASLAMHAVR